MVFPSVPFSYLFLFLRMSVSEGALGNDLDVLALLNNVFFCQESRLVFKSSDPGNTLITNNTKTGSRFPFALVLQPSCRVADIHIEARHLLPVPLHGEGTNHVVCPSWIVLSEHLHRGWIKLIRVPFALHGVHRSAASWHDEVYLPPEASRQYKGCSSCARRYSRTMCSRSRNRPDVMDPNPCRSSRILCRTHRPWAS